MGSAGGDVLDSMIRRNDVPDSLIDACERLLQPTVPEELWPHVRGCIAHARRAHGEAGRFFVLFSALAHSEAARELVARGSPERFAYWHETVLSQGWCDLMMGVDQRGQPQCACRHDEMYDGLVAFVARMTTEYVCAGPSR